MYTIPPLVAIALNLFAISVMTFVFEEKYAALAKEKAVNLWGKIIFEFKNLAGKFQFEKSVRNFIFS